MAAKAVLCIGLSLFSVGCQLIQNPKSLFRGPTMEIPLSIVPEEDLHDASVVSPRLAERDYKRIMLVPPSGVSGPEFDAGLAGAELALMRLGVELISPAITGRVVAGDEGVSDGSSDGSLALSDLERALVLAERSNASAVLQIGELTIQQPAKLGMDMLPSAGQAGHRYFILGDDDSLREVGPGVYESSATGRWRFSAPVVTFTAKLIDVRDGFIVAAFHLQSDIARRLPSTFEAVLRLPQGSVESNGWKWSDSSWTELAVSEAIAEMFQVIGSHLTGG